MFGKMMTEDTNSIELATELTIAWLSNPNTRTSADDVPAFLQSMHAAVSKLGGEQSLDAPEAPAQEYTPAVTARKSLASKEFIISMIDGKPYKTLRRHLATNGMTPAEYRERYNLKADYPMVAEAYSESRRAMAKKIGLGRKPGQTVQKAEEPAPAPAKPRRNAKPAATADAE
jgi:predicted transcriptional regulator